MNQNTNLCLIASNEFTKFTKYTHLEENFSWQQGCTFQAGSQCEMDRKHSFSQNGIRRLSSSMQGKLISFPRLLKISSVQKRKLKKKIFLSYHTGYFLRSNVKRIILGVQPGVNNSCAITCNAKLDFDASVFSTQQNKIVANILTHSVRH